MLVSKSDRASAFKYKSFAQYEADGGVGCLCLQSMSTYCAQAEYWERVSASVSLAQLATSVRA